MKKQRMFSTSHFDPDYARRQINMSSYSARSRDLKQQELLEKEKARFQTSKWQEVTNILEHYKMPARTEDSPVGKILLGL